MICETLKNALVVGSWIVPTHRREERVFVFLMNARDYQDLRIYPGIPIQVVAVQMPFAACLMPSRVIVIVDLRDGRWAMADASYVDAFMKVYEENPTLQSDTREKNSVSLSDFEAKLERLRRSFDGTDVKFPPGNPFKPQPGDDSAYGCGPMESDPA